MTELKRTLLVLRFLFFIGIVSSAISLTCWFIVWRYISFSPIPWGNVEFIISMGVITGLTGGVVIWLSCKGKKEAIKYYKEIKVGGKDMEEST